MKKIISKRKKQLARQKRTRMAINKGDEKRHRLSVFRSNKHLSAQLIDDGKGTTIASASDLKNGKKTETRQERAFSIGKEIAAKALEKKVKKVVFDRGSYAYHGLIKAIAEGAREGGLEF
ncbi:50S ribosomal protein L18 [Candidatus Microgenomates bacterium]|nr:50S ribosomal protein L18 [Candidatus Microgenomates bacterium]